MIGIKFEIQKIIQQINQTLTRPNGKVTQSLFDINFYAFAHRSLYAAEMLINQFEGCEDVKNQFKKMVKKMKQAAKLRPQEDGQQIYDVNNSSDEITSFLNTRKPLIEQSQSKDRGQIYRFLAGREQKQKDNQSFLSAINKIKAVVQPNKKHTQLRSEGTQTLVNWVSQLQLGNLSIQQINAIKKTLCIQKNNTKQVIDANKHQNQKQHERNNKKGKKEKSAKFISNKNLDAKNKQKDGIIEGSKLHSIKKVTNLQKMEKGTGKNKQNKVVRIKLNKKSQGSQIKGESDQQQIGNISNRTKLQNSQHEYQQDINIKNIKLQTQPAQSAYKKQVFNKSLLQNKCDDSITQCASTLQRNNTIHFSSNSSIINLNDNKVQQSVHLKYPNHLRISQQRQQQQYENQQFDKISPLSSQVKIGSRIDCVNTHFMNKSKQAKYANIIQSIAQNNCSSTNNKLYEQKTMQKSKSIMKSKNELKQQQIYSELQKQSNLIDKQQRLSLKPMKSNQLQFNEQRKRKSNSQKHQNFQCPTNSFKVNAASKQNLPVIGFNNINSPSSQFKGTFNQGIIKTSTKKLFKSYHINPKQLDRRLGDKLNTSVYQESNQTNQNSIVQFEKVSKLKNKINKFLSLNKMDRQKFAQNQSQLLQMLQNIKMDYKKVQNKSPTKYYKSYTNKLKQCAQMMQLLHTKSCGHNCRHLQRFFTYLKSFKVSGKWVLKLPTFTVGSTLI